MKTTEKIQFLSAENLNCCRIGEETYLFTVDGYPNYRLICDDQCDFGKIDIDQLTEMDTQMSYNGEMDCTCRSDGDGLLCQREAKFSKTRQRIKQEINRRERWKVV